LNNFRMYVPTDIYFGKDRLHELPSALAPYGKRVLLAYGGGSIKKSGLYDKVTALLNENGFEFVELSGIEPNPRIESVREGVKLIRENKLDMILAVGGGSVVDASKVIAGAVNYEGDAWDLITIDKAKMRDIPALPLIDILTLAATGTEMNRNAVISNMQENRKLGTSGWNLIPKASFLDPTLTFTVNKWQTAAGTADILSHLFEQYFNRTKGVDVQDNIAEGLMKAAIKNGPIAIKEPENYDARANLLWGSTLALNGLPGNGRAGGWTAHPIEHELSAYYDITHGIGLAIITPRWMKHCIDTDPTTHEKFAVWAKNVWGIEEENAEKAARLAVEKLYNFYIEGLEIPMILQDAGIPDQEKVTEMSTNAVAQGGLDGQSPFVSLSVADVEKIISQSFEPMSEF